MGYYDREANVQEYIKMAQGYDGRVLVEVLKRHLPLGSRVLELGMGPGKDLDLLSQDYAVTGSDSSPLFLDLYRNEHPDAELLRLDAVTIDTVRTFDGIYSNKVLIHLDPSELQGSFRGQAQVLNPRGWALHSFWYGDKAAEEHHGLRFYYYTEDDLTRMVGDLFEVVEMARYRETDDDDSIYLLMRRRE